MNANSVSTTGARSDSRVAHLASSESANSQASRPASGIFVNSSSRLGDEELDKIAKAYDSEPWWYDVRGLMILTLSYRSTLWDQLKLFANNVGENHLEVAIGSGTLFDMVLKWRRLRGLPSGRVVGFDYADAMLVGAIRRFRDRSDISLSRGDVAEMPFDDERFDSVNVANAFHCFSRADTALSEIWRVLRPGGRLAMNVLLHPRGSRPAKSVAQRINAWGMQKGILHTSYDAEDIRRRILAAGFDIVSDRVSGNTYEVVAARR